MLIGFLLINSCGYIIVFLQVQQEIRHEMMEKIASESSSPELTAIRVNRFHNDLIWKEDNEFEYRGKLYDIIKMTASKDSCIYYCLNDEKEEALIKNFSRQVDNGFKGGLLNYKLTKVQNNLINYALINSKFSLPRICNLPTNVALSESGYKSIIIQIPSPPPRS